MAGNGGCHGSMQKTTKQSKNTPLFANSSEPPPQETLMSSDHPNNFQLETLTSFTYTQIPMFLYLLMISEHIMFQESVVLHRNQIFHPRLIICNLQLSRVKINSENKTEPPQL
jgi:hypothetical protein